MSTEVEEIKKELIEEFRSRREVEDKIAKEGGDAEAIKRGMDAKKGINGEPVEEKKLKIQTMMMMIMLMKILQIHIADKKGYRTLIPILVSPKDV